MSKRVRHQKILEFLRHHRVTNQEGLKELLRVDGTDVTQATLSRDMRELRLVKVTGADGIPHYSS
ncbi:MAG: arginine repressor, partial [Gemmatimonadota bacterium]|nr:arginine repressor [Gemmatimonadota bacterium]